MTIGARSIGRPEDATDVAAFAGHVLMRAIEFKAGTEVIERRL